MPKIVFVDILDSISRKSNITVYLEGDKNKIDTVKSKIGVLLVKIETRPTLTKLSPDTTAFNFEYASNKWALFTYQIRFDMELLSIEPLLTSDIKAFKQRLRDLQ